MRAEFDVEGEGRGGLELRENRVVLMEEIEGCSGEVEVGF